MSFSFADFSFGDFSFGDDYTCSFRSSFDASFRNFDSFRSFNSAFFASNFTFKNFSTLVTPTRGVLIRWNNDVRTIYENLNKTRQQYNIATVTVPDYTAGTKAVIAHYNDLKSLIEAMSSNAHIGTNAATTGVTHPGVGSPIKYDDFLNLNNIIVRMHDSCINFIGTNV